MKFLTDFNGVFHMYNGYVYLNNNFINKIDGYSMYLTGYFNILNFRTNNIRNQLKGSLI